MQELFRLFTKRNPVVLSKESIKSFGIQSHPENIQSSRFKNWLILCKTNNVEKLKSEMLKFLQSKDSILKIDDLGKDWGKVIVPFFEKGDQLTKEQSYQIIKEAKPDSLFGKEKTAYADKYMAVSDTILSLTYLKSLSHKDNIDYQAVLKVMDYTERTVNSKFQIPDMDLIRHFEKPILLPRCFYRLDPCDSINTADSRFAFLSDRTRYQEEKIAGCKSSNCSCTENEDCVKQSKCCAKPRIDLIDLMVVKTYTKCYQAGDLSYIKNILEGETLSTKHRELNRTEELTETETDVRQFEEKYLQTEDKTSLLNETEEILKSDKGFDAGVTTNFEYGVNAQLYNLKAGGTASANYNSNTSKTISNKLARDYSKNVIDRSTKQLEQKVRNLNSIKRIHETEEKNKHEFDNSKGENINGQYLFVNKISRAQVYNYGRHPVIDLILPEPAALYKRLFEKKYDGLVPVEPKEITITAKEIDEKNIDELITRYHLKDTLNPPQRNLEVIGHFDGGKGTEKEHIDFPRENRGSERFPIWFPLPPVITYSGCGSETNNTGVDVPDGYYTDVFSTDWGFNLFNGHGISSCYVEMKLGDDVLFLNGDNRPASTTTVTTKKYEGHQTIFLTANNATEYHFDYKVTFKIKDSKFLEWQTGIFNKIMETYEKALEKYEKDIVIYNQEKKEFEAKLEQEKKDRYNKNPFALRELEKAELKRMAISYISCQFYDQFDSMKNRVEPCGYPEMNIKQAAEDGKFIQFFEQSFNWNLLTYIFYPYFWGKKCSWGKNLKEEATDLIFEKFLQAGSCHIQIPIRPTHFDTVNHFIDFGEILGGDTDVPKPNDPNYISLAQEIKEQFQNFNTERKGRIDVTNGDPVVMLNGTDEYWDTTNNVLSQPTIDADLDREILLNYKTYRIVSITENPNVTTHLSWLITLDRPYEGITDTKLMWSTGAVYIGAPWEFITPTNLVYLRDKSKCLPCYPLKDCIE